MKRPANARDLARLLCPPLVWDGLKAANSDEGNAAVEAAVKKKVVELTDRFPLYPSLTPLS